VRQLATVSPLKDQLAVVAALAGVRHLAWTAELTGAVDVHPRYVAAVRAAIERHGLSARIRLTGPLLGEELERAWAETDLLLLPSRVETWGLVVTEALAHGVPVVVSAGTGAVEALGRAPDCRLPGAHVPPGDTAALARSIAALLADGGAARRAALARRGALPGWRRTARTVLAALGEAA
jgi:glycosyltransferase involved in cell wall biosynthesis